MKVFLTVRSASTRLPDKCFLDLGGITVLQHMIRRCRHFGFEAHVCTTLGPEDDRVEELAYTEGLGDRQVFRGSVEPRQRWFDAAEWFHINAFHVIDCDDPFFCPQECRHSFQYLENKHAHCVLPPVQEVNYGTGLVGTSYAVRKGETLILPDRQGPLMRLTLDYLEDYAVLQTLIRLGAGYTTPRTGVESMLFNPLWRVNDFRNEDYRKHKAVA
jgi:spore coat polysaccharide biosynthesis protein SpsF (cytidylyltransferase family)